MPSNPAPASPSRRGPALIALACLAAVAVVTVAVLVGRAGARASVLSGPFATLPADSAMAVSYTTRPGLGQATALAKAVTSAQVPDKEAAEALASWLPKGAAGMSVWPGQGQPWAGPRYAWSWIDFDARAVQVAAVEVSDTDAARAWAQRSLDPAATTWDVVTEADTHVLRIAATPKPDLLASPQLASAAPNILTAVDSAAPAVVWMNAERMSDPVLYQRVPMLRRLAATGVLGPGTTGQFAFGISLSGNVVAADGVAEQVSVGGAPLAGSKRNLTAALEQLPATTGWAVAVSDPGRLYANWAVAELWGALTASPQPTQTATIHVPDPNVSELPAPTLPSVAPTPSASASDVSPQGVGTQLVVASSETGQLGAVFTGADQSQLPNLFSPFASFKDAPTPWVAPVVAGDRAGSAESQGWADMLTVAPSQRLASKVNVSALLDSGTAASSAAVVMPAANASGVAGKVAAMGVVVAGSGHDSADIHVRTLLRTG